MNDDLASGAASPPPQRSQKSGCRGCLWIVAGLLLAGFSLLVLAWWDRQPIWQEGDLRIYTSEGEHRLGIYHGSGYINLVEGNVTGVGLDERWLVVRKWSDHKLRYYVVERSKPLEDLAPWDFDEHAYDQAAFNEMKTRLNLPPFTWQHRKAEKLQ